MKKLFFYSSILIGSSILFFSGCTKNNPEPSPTDPRSVFLGQWNVRDIKKKLNYQVYISADASASNKISIKSFGDFDPNSSASAATSGNEITLEPNQTLGTVRIIGGKGTYNSSSNTIAWSYSYNDGADQPPVSEIYSR
jgi:hypothetical protein